MDRMILDRMLSWFQDWVDGMMTESGEDMASFYNAVLEHTYRVRQHAVTLGKTEKMTEDSLMLLELICLFHDLGRFRELYMTRRGIMPFVSEHGATGVNILSKLPLMVELSPEEASILNHAVLHHGDYECPKDLDPKVLSYLNLLRDADKLDAYYTEVHRSAAKLHQRVTPTDDHKTVYSKSLVRELMAGRSIHEETLVYPMDKVLMFLGYLFDFNFVHSFWVIEQQGYVDRLLDKLPQDQDIKELRMALNAYVIKHLTRE